MLRWGLWNKLSEGKKEIEPTEALVITENNTEYYTFKLSVFAASSICTVGVDYLQEDLSKFTVFCKFNSVNIYCK